MPPKRLLACLSSLRAGPASDFRMLGFSTSGFLNEPRIVCCAMGHPRTSISATVATGPVSLKGPDAEKFLEGLHDFIGRAALEAEIAHPKRTVVTLPWNPEDVIENYASLLRPGEERKTIGLPYAPNV